MVTHNLRSEDIEGWTKELLMNESYRNVNRSDKVYFYHDIISFGSNDKNMITNEMLEDMTRKYIELRGKQGMYLAAVHNEGKENMHVHLLTSGLEYRSGKAFWISKSNLHELKVNLQNYQKEKYPKLENSIVTHGKSREKFLQQRNLLKDEIANKVKVAFEQSHSQKEFLETLQNNNLHYYERKNQIQGITYNETKFRFSRLDISLDDLPTDTREEQKTLEEINSLRESRSERKRSLDMENDADRYEIEDEEIGR